MQDLKKKEEALLLISGSKGSKILDKEYSKKISGAILSCMFKHENAKLRCCGAASINNALKGILIAKESMIENNEYFLLDPSFTTVYFDDDEKTGLMLNMVKVDGIDVDGNTDRSNAILKIKGSQKNKDLDKEYVKKLANAVLSCFDNQGTALLRCCGAASINNALKAIVIAKEEALKRDVNFMINPSFTTVIFNNEEKTGVILELIKV